MRSIWTNEDVPVRCFDSFDNDKSLVFSIYQLSASLSDNFAITSMDTSTFSSGIMKAIEGKSLIFYENVNIE